MMTTLRQLTLLGVALFAAATPLHAQALSVVCNPTGEDGGIEMLKAFSGTYNIQPHHLSSQDSLDASVMGPIESLHIPSRIGPGHRNTFDDYHGNREFGAPDAILKLKPKEHLSIGISEAFRTSRSDNWCTTKTPGVFYFRGSFLFDWRYQYDLTLTGHDSKYRGVRTTADIIPGTGFPVHRVYVRDVQKANESADRFYGNLDAMKSTPFYSYEVELYGTVSRQDYWGRLISDPRIKNFRLVRDTTWGPKFKYEFHITGQIRMRSYVDARIGVPGHNVGGAEFVMEVNIPGEVWETDFTSEMEDYPKKIQKICGNPFGCGYVGALPPAVGMIRHIGTDEEERGMEICRVANSGQDCFGESNAMIDEASLRATDADFESLEGPLAPDLPNVTEAQKRQVNTGRRTVAEGVEASVPSQLARYCLTVRQRDSVSVVNGPRDIGTNAPTYVAAPDRFREPCRSVLFPPPPPSPS